MSTDINQREHIKMSNAKFKKLKLHQERTYAQIDRGVRRVVNEIAPTENLRNVYKMERADQFKDYDFDSFDVAAMVLTIEQKYDIVLPVHDGLPYRNMTLGTMIYDTYNAIRGKKLHPKTINEIYYVFWQILNKYGWPTTMMNRDEKLKKYNVGPYVTLALIQELENDIGLKPTQISKEIEKEFNNSATYDYYNEMTISDIVRIAHSKIHVKTKSVKAQPTNPAIAQAINDYRCIIK